MLWLADCRRLLQATSSCWLVGMNIIRAVIWTWRFFGGYCVECDRLIEKIRKYELLWKSDHKDFGKHGPHMVAWKKIASALDRGYSCSLCTNRVNHSRCSNGKLLYLIVHYFPLGYITWHGECCKLYITYPIAGSSQVGVPCNDWRVSDGLHARCDDQLSHQLL